MNGLRIQESCLKGQIHKRHRLSHALIKGFSELIGDMAIGWGLCFPDGDLSSQALPTSIDSSQIIDQLGLLHVDKALEYLFRFCEKTKFT